MEKYLFLIEIDEEYSRDDWYAASGGRNGRSSHNGEPAKSPPKLERSCAAWSHFELMRRTTCPSQLRLASRRFLHQAVLGQLRCRVGILSCVEWLRLRRHNFAISPRVPREFCFEFLP
jgi:hypothetical protein